MAEAYAAFVDVGFLRAEGARSLGWNARETRPHAQGLVDWLRHAAFDATFLRANWYDGAFAPEHPEAPGQRKFFDAIAQTPGIQLRLGHISERGDSRDNAIVKALDATGLALGLPAGAIRAEFERHFSFRPLRQQKGVDTLLALDLVRLAGRAVCSTAVLVAGDRDLAEAVRAAQDFGVRVIVATPRRSSVARELAQLADEIVEISADKLEGMLQQRGTTPTT